MSCNYQTLYNGEDGYVVRCNSCGLFQMAFISTVISFTKKDFYSFYKQVRSISVELYTEIDRSAKCIMVATPSKEVQLILTPTELQKLQQMVEFADNEMKAQELLCLFK